MCRAGNGTGLEIGLVVYVDQSRGIARVIDLSNKLFTHMLLKQQVSARGSAEMYLAYFGLSSFSADSRSV